MQPYQQAFIELAMAHNVLKFGEFTLKSGRISPYFFNAGLFHSGKTLADLGRYYAQAIVNAGLKVDMLFGPAYKGIPLVTTTSVALANDHNLDYPVCYNRKEAKDHGEGGVLVGAPLEGRVAIIDDVMTAGTAVREVISVIQSNGAIPAAVVIGLDRQERGNGSLSAIQELEKELNIPVISIVKLDHIIAYVDQHQNDPETSKAIKAYRTEYGVNT